MDKRITATATATIIDSKPILTGFATKINAVKPRMPANITVKATVATTDKVRVVQPDEYKLAAASLAEAFEHDHTQEYIIDTPDRAHWTKQQKWDLHVEMMEYITYAHCLKGLVTTIGDDYGCVALWMPPGKNMDDLLTIFRSGMWRLSYKLSTEGKKRLFNEFLPLLHDTKAQVLGERDDEAWYLVYVGTRPSAQGKGYCRKIITHVTDMADAHGRPCYLESSNAINVKIYGKMGFEVKKKIHLQRAVDNIELDIMVREPVTGVKAI